LRRPRLSTSKFRASFEGRASDGFQYVFETREHVVVVYAQNCETAVAQDGVAAPIARDLLLGAVRRAIDLDDQFRLEAGKIDDELPERNLPTKMQALNRVSSKARPEQTLGSRGVASQRSRDLRGRHRALRLAHSSANLSTSAGRPLPHFGGGPGRGRLGVGRALDTPRPRCDIA
jgi:hypothetical protein